MAGINRWDYGIEKKKFLFRIVGLKNPIGDAQMCFVYKVGKRTVIRGVKLIPLKLLYKFTQWKILYHFILFPSLLVFSFGSCGS